MKNTITRYTLALLLVVWLSVGVNGNAYNEGGHYYTLLALFDSLVDTNTPDERLKEIKLEAFCAELPDLGRELDAIAQRARVAKSWSDNLWGLLGQCQSTVSSHMVAAQYYLHGLTGSAADPLRQAANDIVTAIGDDLAKPQPRSSQDRRNLICARGFAEHLYGDSFAHVKLSSEQAGFLFYRTPAEGGRKMYNTGLGHARDGHDPDYLYGHSIDIDRWPRWVDDAGALIAKAADVKRIKDKHTCTGSLFSCEEPERRRLKSFPKMKGKLMVADMQNLIATGNTGIGDMERATSCEDVVKKVFPNLSDRPDCSETWTLYLERATPIFADRGIDPTSGLKATADKTCSAWRCAGKASYGGESPNSCKVEITDRLSFGREPQ